MRGALAGVLGVVVAVAGCSKQVTPSEPRAGLVGDHDGFGDPAPTAAVVGQQLTVRAAWFASCLDWEPSKGEYSQGSTCAHQEFELAITCDGPCVIEDRHVMPQQPGPLTITATLTGHERTATFHFPIDVLEPDGFWLIGCTNVAINAGVIEPNKAIRTDGDRCVIGARAVGVGVLGGDHAFDLDVGLGGVGLGGVATRRLTPEVIGMALGAGGPVGPGIYPVELSFGGFHRTLQVEITPLP